MRSYSLYRVSVSEKSKGGRLSFARPRGTRGPRGCHLLTIYVHGLNNHEYEALQRWDDDIWPGMDRLISRQTSDIMLLFWPSVLDIRKILSLLEEYTLRVETAIGAGVLLSEYIKELSEDNPNLRVQLVGHSLGCRVILSAVQQLSEQPQKVAVARQLLIGAAVPEGDCTEQGPWPKKVSDLFRIKGRRLSKNSDVILYSQDDEILGWKFQAAEAGARRRGLESFGSRKAVGLTGGPSPNRWTEVVHFPRMGHSDYLTEPDALQYVAGMVGRLVDRPVSKRPEDKRLLDEKKLGQRRLASMRPRG